MDQCIYCNKKIEVPYTIIITNNNSQICCSEECMKKASSFYNHFMKSKPYFYVSIFLSLGLILSGAIVDAIMSSHRLLAVLLAAGFILLGVTLLLFPFATPESFDKWGIKKTAKIVKALGIFIIMLGPALALFLRA
ncbi:MAG: hypothetical protein K0Q87_1208 [Neobacillus sp.]|nr:hypothetical protein [Neobacillus sp.]